MLSLILLSVIIGYYIAVSGWVTKLFRQLQYRGPDNPDRRVEDPPKPPEDQGQPVTISKGRRITIFYKKSKNNPEGSQRYVCDFIRYEKGYLILYLYDSLDEIEINIKDVDQIIL